jgi:hypothetical protein
MTTENKTATQDKPATEKKKDFKTTIRFHNAESQKKFTELKNGHANIGDFLDDMMSVYEASKLAKTPQTANIPDNAIVLSEAPKKFFQGNRDGDAEKRQLVQEKYNIDSFEMNDVEFLNLVVKSSGKSKNEIISTALESYGKTLLTKYAKSTSDKDDDVMKAVNKLTTQILAGERKNLTCSVIQSTSSYLLKRSVNYDFVKDWAKRKGVYEMIKDTDNCVTKENVTDFLAKLK